MPWGDGTGPDGAGPMTGRGLGYCGGYNSLGFTKGVPRGGAGFGRGAGFRRGFGRGFGFRRGFARWPTAVQRIPTEKDEKEYLEDELKALEQEMKEIEARLKELNKE